jgi:undecaprenyl-diphosphatase
MIEFFNNIDTQLYLFFNCMHTTWLDHIMMMCTGRYTWIPLYICIAILLVKTFGVKLSVIYLVAIGLAITVTDQTCATLIRPIVARMRPSNPDNPLSMLATLVDGYRGGRYGFPSCHSANSFALAVLVSCLIRRPGTIAFMFSWALLNSYTRLYLGVHYPGDLFVGAIIGSGIGYLFYRIDKRFFPAQREKAIASMRTPIYTINTGIKALGNRWQHLDITAIGLMMSVGAITLATIIIIGLCQ